MATRTYRISDEDMSAVLGGLRRWAADICDHGADAAGVKPGAFELIERLRADLIRQRDAGDNQPTGELFIVRQYDGMDNQWVDVTPPVSRDEADRVWNERTANGTRKTTFKDIDYYRIFPAETRMLFSDGFGER